MDPTATPTPPAIASGMQPGQPPTGTSPATQPVANRGQEAAGLAMVSVAVKILEKSFGLLGVGNDAGKDVLDCLKRLSKHVPAGQTPPGVENGAMQNTMDENRRNAMMMQMRSAQPPAPAAPPMPMPQAA